MESIKINTGIKEYAIENENGDTVAVLTLDTKNKNIMNRFADMLERSRKISEDFEKEFKEFEEKTGDTITPTDVRDITNIYAKAVNQLIEETESIFGDNLIHDIFFKNYELDRNFVPDISALTEFYMGIRPIIESVYRPEGSKYSPTKKGKTSREEQIKAFKEKNDK